MSDSNQVKRLSGRPVDPNSKRVQAAAVYASLTAQSATREDILTAMVDQVKVSKGTAQVYYSNFRNPPDPNRTVVRRGKRKSAVETTSASDSAPADSVETEQNDSPVSTESSETDSTST